MLTLNTTEMKKSLIALAVLCSFTAFAQNMAAQEVQYNQYGVKVSAEPLVTENQDGILVHRSTNDSGFKVWLDMRVQADGAVFFGENEDLDPIGNGLSIRRARFAVKSQINKNWYGEIDMDMANGVFELKDAIIRFDGIPNTQIQIGNFKEFFSIQRNNSSRYLQFMERPMVAQALAPSRHIGANVKWAKNWLWLSGGVFGQTIDILETRTFVEDANKDFGKSQGLSYTGKFVLMPGYKNENWGLHLAGALSYRQPNIDDEQMSVSPGNFVRFSTRNSNSINRKKYIDTGEIADVDHDLLYTAEIAGYYKGLRFEGAYMADDNFVTTSSTPNHLWGWYAQAGYLLFGGRQRYDTGGAKFTRVSRGREWGDIELCARYEYVDFNAPALMAGSAEAYALGINYYINNNVKFVINYQYNNDDSYANGKGNKFLVGYDAAGKATSDYKKVVSGNGKAGVDYHMLAVRFEINF